MIQEPSPHKFVRIRREPFEAIWPALEPMVRAHALEVEPDSPRRIKVDVPRMIQADRLGILMCFTLRVDGELKGYCSWNLAWDLESEGLPIATQGAWFAEEDAPWGSAAKLFVLSIDELKRAGVQCVFPHHRMLGRGAKIGRFFKSLGAVPTQETYMLWIGE